MVLSSVNDCRMILQLFRLVHFCSNLRWYILSNDGLWTW